ncbi:hypothetical protein WJX81_008069 [Elliptochloris bilobata]|uniref:Ubiquitin-like domain-containing protein n=1 Tax=Elliptochloris bilobata TaxID=381761 RepID=A0AAW1RGX0_9CHLO
MEASRLVFVSVKDAKPRRKVAVPVPDTATWEQFCRQVQTKLKLIGVESIFLASSGEQVTRLDNLQDIDELHVVEAKPPPPVVAASVAQGNGSASVLDTRASSGNGATTSIAANGAGAGGTASAAAPVPLPPGLYRPTVAAERGVVAADATEIEARDDGEGDDGDGGEAKYARRPRSVRRSLQRAFPALFSASLPITARDVKDNGEAGKRGGEGRPGRRRRRGRAFPDVRSVLAAVVALAFLGFLALLYARVSPRLP